MSFLASSVVKILSVIVLYTGDREISQTKLHGIVNVEF
jgi:hypothetical protein